MIGPNVSKILGRLLLRSVCGCGKLFRRARRGLRILAENQF
jgi:hypothetical protein